MPGHGAALLPGHGAALPYGVWHAQPYALPYACSMTKAKAMACPALPYGLGTLEPRVRNARTVSHTGYQYSTPHAF